MSLLYLSNFSKLLSNIWPKISIYLMNDVSIDPYLTGGNTIVISNYLVKFVLPIKYVISAIKVAWTYNICLQIISIQNISIQNISIQNINLEGFASKNFVNLHYYRSEVINPKYFNSFEEFNSYVILIWEDSYNKIYEDNKSESTLVNSYSINSYIINYSNTFFLFYNLIPIFIFIYLFL